MLYAMPYVHLNPDHINRTKYSILELNWNVPKCKCLNRIKNVQILYFSSLIIAMWRQSKQKSNNTDQLAITMNTAQNNKIHNYHKIAAFSRQKSSLRGFSLEAGSLLSRAGRCKGSVCSAILSSCKDCTMLYAMPYVYLNPDHNNRTKYSILKLNWHVPKCKCLNCFKASKYRILVL